MRWDKVVNKRITNSQVQSRFYASTFTSACIQLNRAIHLAKVVKAMSASALLSDS